MKFIIEVEDFWLDEEEITEALQSHIKMEVVREIQKNIKDKVDEQITKKIKEVVDQKISLVIDDKLTDLIATGVINYDRKEISLVDHIKKQFESHSGWHRPNDHIDKIAKEFGAELKIQYNAIFANKIVSSLKEQGFLKDELVQVLLEGDKKSG